MGPKTLATEGRQKVWGLEATDARERDDASGAWRFHDARTRDPAAARLRSRCRAAHCGDARFVKDWGCVTVPSRSLPGWVTLGQSLCVVGIFVLLGCGDPCRTATEAKGEPAGPFPRYYLSNTALLDKPNGKRGPVIEGPVLVELLPGGRVRAVTPAKERVDGYLPEILQYLPGEEDAGLLLYAQRVADLHLERPDGKKMGRLHRGALVSVVPGRERFALIRLPEFMKDGQPLVAFVERSALGIEPHEIMPVTYSTRGRSLLGYSFPFDETQAVQSLPCREVWLDFEHGSVSQVVGGVELVGKRTEWTPWFTGGRSRGHLSTLCPAHALLRAEGHFLTARQEPRGLVLGHELDGIPNGYRRVELSNPDPLAEAIRSEKTVWWLVEEEGEKGQKEVFCEAWSFEVSNKKAEGGVELIEGRLRAPKAIDVDGKKVRPHYPFTYRPSDGRDPARLHLEMIVPNQTRCLCEADFSLLAAYHGELLMMSRPLPASPVAFREDEAEWWYLTRGACEGARTGASIRVNVAPWETTRIGLRADPPAC
jgi:hypothetical protein